MIETIVCTFEISNTFEEWVEKFDHVEAPARHDKGIRVLFRGVSKQSPNQVVVIVQAEVGVVSQHIQDNLAFFSKNGAVMQTAVPMAYWVH
tara:strand:+ start:493 stop:765 length:273 start_codon:yes stop_codon:yes gene_type:complete